MALLGESWEDPLTAANFAVAGGLMSGNLPGGLAEMARIMSPQARMQRQLAELSLREGTMKLEDFERKRRDDDAAREELRSYYGGKGMPGAGAAPALPGALGSGSFGVLPEPRGAAPAATSAAVAPKADLWTAYREIGNRMAARGLVDQAQQYFGLAEKFRPKYGTEPRVMMQDGKPVNVLVGEDGTTQVLPFGVKPNIKLQDLGGQVVAVDENAVPAGQTWGKSMTPGERDASARGWADIGVKRETNNILSQGNVIKTETDLRKEFADLPEVKNYKAAYPSYRAIEEASKRANPQADINLIYGLAKLYDPTSVVREGEYSTIANSQAVPEWLKGAAQALAGGGKLTPTTKAQILQEAQGRIAAYENEYAKARNTYTSIAKQRGASSDNIFTPVGEPVAAPAAKEPAAKEPAPKRTLSELPKNAPMGQRIRDTATGKVLRFNGLQWAEEK